ncbi:STAS domain-containing protein [Paractinoplanes lichenicola]|uniref:STAS domain-containing protein n=1 Tax=Paractinoplanes lichenicola TaxID=2802976 RepID=A0ABS1VR43_9ACTN|nr:STAS domain-containing protein [Actinoplanes lichenicola]MBL7256021.1 STAS domain-containing protein [Actinoplanes lichenicola]
MTAAPEGFAGRWCHWDSGSDGVPRFIAVGDLDRDCCSRLAAALNAVAPGSTAAVEIDMADATLLDAAAARVLIDYHNAARSRGGQVRVIHADGMVRHVLDILWPARPGEHPVRVPVQSARRRSASLAELFAVTSEINAAAHDTVARSRALRAEMLRRQRSDHGRLPGD